MMRKMHSGRLTKALLETADDMQRVGILDAATHQRITLRHTEERRVRYRLDELLAGITPENLPDTGFDDAPVGREAL
jgi:hypothetical protein